MTATIEIPAEHVEAVRHHLFLSLADGGRELIPAGDDGQPDACRQAAEKIRLLAKAMEQIGWKGEGSRTLTADRGLLAEPIQRALEYARDDIGGDWVDRSKLPALRERARWLSDTLDSLEPETVGAA